jgi:NAD(P)H-flavin reductase/NAD-dependent dihydropyrimidine dehydrogenase PreA subunit
MLMNQESRFESLYYIDTNRAFTLIRKYAWIFTITVAFAGLWYPKLGLFVLPVITGLSFTAFFKGRYWCGNICPHGSLFDSLLMPLSKNKKIPVFFKSIYFRAAIFAFFSFSIGRKLINVINIFGEAPFLDKLGFIFVTSYLVVTILGGITTILVSPRTWCQFCPMGTLQHISYKFGKFLNINQETDKKVTIQSNNLCHECGMCARVCPMQLKPYLEFNEAGQLDNEACIRCNTCVENCPAGILEIKQTEEDFNLLDELELNYYDKQIFKSKIINIRNLSENIKEFTFKIIEQKNIQAEAGQFILIKVSDQHEMYRAYSIAGIEDNGSVIKISVMKAADGYGTSIIFSEFNEGDEIELKGPMGHELIVDKEFENVLLVAGGIGITPFIPIIEDLTENENKVKNVKLIYGVNEEEQFLYRDFFEDMDKRSDKFDFVPVVAFDENWKGEKGFVTDVINKLDIDKYKIYMCGPEAMENAARNLLLEKDFDMKNIYAEST